MLQIMCFTAVVGFLSVVPAAAFGQVSYEEYSMQKDSVSFDEVARYTVSIQQQDGKLGLKNILGEWIAAPEYDWIDQEPGRFSAENKILRAQNGLIRVKKGELEGVLSLTGKVLIPCLYTSVIESDISSDVLIVESPKGRAYCDLNGNLLSPFVKEYHPVDPTPWEEGPKSRQPDPFYAGIGFQFKATSPQMAIDAENAFANYRLLNSLKDRYYRMEIRPFSEGYAAFVFHLICLDNYRCPYGGVENGSIGYLDNKGKIAIAPQFPSANIWRDNGGYGYYWWKPDFYGGRAMIWEKETFYYIDTTGKKVFELDYGGQFYRAFPFHPGGWTTVVWTDKKPDGTYTHYQDFIGAQGQRLARVASNTSHMGTGGNYWESARPEYDPIGFWDGERREQLWITADLQDTTVFNREDTLYNYRYTYAKQIVAVVRACKSDGEKSMQLVDYRKNALTDWSDENRFTDPFTGITIVRQNGGCRMTDRRDSLLFACDSCGFQTLSNLYNYPDLSLSLTPGLYEFWGKNKPGCVNYKGEKLPYGQLRYAGLVNLGDEKYQRKEKHTVRYQFTKQELDALYATMPWKYIPPPPPPKPKPGERLQFLPPVIVDDPQE